MIGNPNKNKSFIKLLIYMIALPLLKICMLFINLQEEVFNFDNT